MKLSPLILLIALIGCSRSETPNPASQMSHQIQQWVPDQASLVTVREIMEQHHFGCSVQSYTNSQATDVADGDILGQTVRIKGQAQVVTNVCYLKCVSPSGQARFTFWNQRYFR